ncbi:hypothetical protein BX666DRAFT_643698 [Dichotomocladium elegans]|nr:hypothetical protein BX666DRAFT_643698 [Dichotomocladium elegans]
MVIFLTSSIISFYVLVVWYGWWHFGPAKTSRQRSYVITLLGSCIMTFCSLPILYRAMTSPDGFMSLFAPSPTWTIAVVAFFMTSLASDLGIGVIFYRNKINLLTGWIHHAAYILVLIYVIHHDLSRFFVGMCILELPTLSLSIGSVFPRYRYDYVFAAFYVPTRIGFHAFMLGYTFVNVRPVVVDVTLGLTVLFPLHCYWFYGFVLQQKRLGAKRLAAASSPRTTTMQPREQALDVASLVSPATLDPKRSISPLVCTTIDLPIDSGAHATLVY